MTWLGFTPTTYQSQGRADTYRAVFNWRVTPSHLRELKVFPLKSFFHNCFFSSVQKAVRQFSTQCQSAQFADDSVVDSAVALSPSLSGQQNWQWAASRLNSLKPWLMFLANINVSKTKEMIIDSRRYPTVSSPRLINNQAAERERQYKYLSTGIVDKLTIEP